MNSPKTLYHYTSVETLALILSSRKIRFCPLSNVNDATEGYSSDSGVFSKYIFTSCWTANYEESIPMWKLYTDLKGVRIGLPFPVFNYHNFKVKSNSLVSESEFVGNGYMILPEIDPIVKVGYTNDQNALQPRVRFQDGEMTGFHLRKLGRYKSKYWEFEKEYRFMIYMFPLNGDGTVSPWELLEKNKPDLKIHEFYLPVRHECFREMQIVMGPHISKGQEVLLRALLDKFNSGVVPIRSKISLR